jgi:hypothetical protein
MRRPARGCCRRVIGGRPELCRTAGIAMLPQGSRLKGGGSVRLGSSCWRVRHDDLQQRCFVPVPRSLRRHFDKGRCGI